MRKFVKVSSETTELHNPVGLVQFGVFKKFLSA